MCKLKTFTVLLSAFTIVASDQQDNVVVDRMDRLLLTDPDFAGTRLTNVEKNVQDLKQSVSQLKGERAQEKQAVLQLQNDLSLEKQAVLKLQNDLSQEKQNVIQLQNGLSQEKQTREQEKLALDKFLQMFNGYGSTYVRWGRKQCPSVNTETIYSGFAAGQIYAYQSTDGGPANMLCLPNNPELSNRTTPRGSFIYGTEYEDSFFPGAINEDVPCSLCRSINTTTSVMIPGRNSCYKGWKMEYQGFLASNHMIYRASSFVCVDSGPEFLQGGERSNDNNVLYVTAAQCGSLPCPPYSNNMAVNCVVCSK